MFRKGAHDLRRRAAQAVAADRPDRVHPGAVAVAIDPALLAAWLAGRSLARNLPPPIAERGALRVDTGAEDEVCRWVFTQPGTAITELCSIIDQPGYLIKACLRSADLAALLGGPWRVESENCVMIAEGLVRLQPELPPGYRSVVRRDGGVTHVRILDHAGLPAASGYAAETAGAFVYDRIVTAPAHRRRGLGGALMAVLGASRRSASSVDILTATVAGRALYERLGWRVYAPWATAAVPPAGSG